MSLQITRLIIAKSLIRGEPLSFLINSQSLSNEKKYTQFKTKFLEYFAQQENKAVTQYHFSNLKMFESETIRQFASRVDNCTDKFFGKVNFQAEEMSSVYERTRLAKLLEGVLDKYKIHLLTRDCKTIKEAIDFVELLETSNKLITTQSLNTVTQPEENVLQ